MSEQESAPNPRIKFNVLCSFCESVFSRVDEGEDEEISSPFHSLRELEESAAKGCHFCNTLRVYLRRSKHLVSEVLSKQLSNENLPLVLTTYYSWFSKGFVFQLWRDGDHSSNILITVFCKVGHPADETQHFLETRHTFNEDNWNLVLKWIQRCSNNHVACQPKSVSMPKNEWPTRLISVGNMTSPTVRVAETSDLGTSMPVYMTLSHCWGNYVPVRLLTHNNSGPRKWDIKDLPKTFEDAITVTRKLGVQYLWIDSLCIIQDSDLDWATESSKMHNVYRNSHLNIAAAASSDSTGGLFYLRSPLELTPCRIKIGRGAGAKCAISQYTTEMATSDELVLFTRAWVFQERLLASRTVVFGRREIYWECSDLHASEIRPEGLQHSDSFYNRGLVELRNQWRKIQKESIVDRLRMWNRIITDYSHLSLTVFSDKLVAIAGLAAEMGKTWDGIEYLAGLWSYKLRNDLLWYRDPERISQQRPCLVPSWSWASLDGGVFTSVDAPTGTKIADGLVEIIDAAVQLSAPYNIYGSVTGGSIQIKGPILRAKINHNGERIEIGQIDEDGDHFRSDISVYATWDDSRLSEVQPFDVYLAPFKISYTWELDLEGLILLPTFLTPGQFRRVGYFCVSDSTDKTDKGFQKTIGQMRATMQNDNELREEDPYGNGVVNTTLIDRYGIDKRGGYPKINSLLSAAFAKFKIAEAEENLREDIYGVSHGNGYFTYENV